MIPKPNPISPRAYKEKLISGSWEEIWEAGPYYDRITELLETAKEYAIFAGWQIDSRLPLRTYSKSQTLDYNSTSPTESLRDKVIRICQENKNFHFYFIFWDHSYLYVWERQLWQGRIWDEIHPRIHFVFDNRHPFGASHHEKVSIFDGKTALCGGIDLCDERWDSPQHLYLDPRRSLNRREEHHGPYHDLAVQVSGPICTAIQAHIERRWRAISTIPFPKSHSFQSFKSNVSGAHQVYVSRTIAQIDYFPKEYSVIREVEFLFRDLIEAAEYRIILEGQYYWSKVINDMLISKMHRMAGKNFEIILILADLEKIKSLTRHMMSFELTLLRQLELVAQYTGTHLILGSPFVYSPQKEKFLPPKPIYIHSKVIIVDDHYLAIGSANFATRALRIDTEIHLTLEARTEMERVHIRRVAQQVIDHWQIGSHPENQDIQLRELKPLVQLNHLKKDLNYSQKIPWHYFFDPGVCWSYPFKFRSRFAPLRSYFRSPLKGLSVGWFLLLVCVYFKAGLSTWTFLYGALISSIWLFPIPFVLVSGLSALQLGPDVAVKVSVFGMWIASILGYWYARSFPYFAGRYSGKVPQAKLENSLGLRNFSGLLLFLAHPAVSLRMKIVYQGLYFVPLPWFILGTVLILPAVFFAALSVLFNLLKYF